MYLLLRSKVFFFKFHYIKLFGQKNSKKKIIMGNKIFQISPQVFCQKKGTQKECRSKKKKIKDTNP